MQRAGQKTVTVPGPDWGLRIIQPAVAAVGGWWDNFGAIACCIAAYQAKNAADYAASKVDLSGNGNDAADGVPAGWNPAQGWIFAGVEWLDTLLLPVNNQTWSFLIQYTNAVQTAVPISGCSTGAAGFMLRPWRVANTVGYRTGGNLDVPPQLATGNAGFAGNQGYRNGVADGGAIPPSAGAIGDTLLIGAYGAGGLKPFQIYPNCQIQAYVLYNCTLNAGEVAAVAAAMAAL